MEKKLTKADLVAKIAKEQNLEPKKLSRLSMDQLYQMDKIVPDEGADILGGEAPESPTTPDTTPASDENADNSGTNSEGESDLGQGTDSSPVEPTVEGGDDVPTVEEKPEAQILLGYHPVTGKPVYK